MGHIGLPRDWAFRPALDLELKQYTLLAYLQVVRGRFNQQKLYPHLEELQAHLHELIRVRQEKEQWSRVLGTQLLGFDPRTGLAVHEPLMPDDWLSVVDELIAWAVPGLQDALAEGLEIREALARRIAFAPVGLLPLDASAGWLLLRAGSEARAYAYRLSSIQPPPGSVPASRLRTRYVASYTVSLACTYESIKSDLVRKFRSEPNPAVYVFEAEVGIPCIETFMPLAKHLVYEQVAAASGPGPADA